MTRISSRIGNSALEGSGISSPAAGPPRPPSSVEKKGGSAILQATPTCGMGTKERSITCLNGTAIARFGCIIVDFSGAEAYRDGVKVQLTAYEVKVLRYFADNPGRVISRQELLDAVWGYDAYPTTRTVDNQICKLRKKLEPDPKNPCHFVTMHGIGYKFVHEFEGGVPARFQSLQPSIRGIAAWEGERDGADLRNVVLGYLSVVYEFLARSYPQGSMQPEGAKRSIIPECPGLLSPHQRQVPGLGVAMVNPSFQARNRQPEPNLSIELRKVS
jgi:DNA-binding winged helix-turn-helix (wHTH) protein